MHSIYIFFLMIPRPPRSTLFPYRRSSDIAMVESGAGLAVMPTLALPACLKRRVTLHALVDPVASGTLYWIVNRARKLPAAADGFNAFLRQYVSGVVERWPPAAAKAA